MARRKVEPAPVDQGSSTGATIDGGGGPEPERAAIQDEGSTPAAAFGFIAQAGHPLNGASAPQSLPGTAVSFSIGAVASDDEGSEVTVTKAEEIYGRPNSFGSYRVGPFVLKAVCRQGESRLDLGRKLRAELETLAAEERVRARASYLAHLEKAF